MRGGVGFITDLQSLVDVFVFVSAFANYVITHFKFPIPCHKPDNLLLMLVVPFSHLVGFGGVKSHGQSRSWVPHHQTPPTTLLDCLCT